MIGIESLSSYSAPRLALASSLVSLHSAALGASRNVQPSPVKLWSSA